MIDNIFCNNILNEQALSGILYTDISDHYPIFYIHHSLKKKPSKDVYITKRSYTPQNIAKFKTNLESHNWSAVLLHTETQTAYSLFHKEFSHIYDNCFPVRSVKLGYKNRKTWLTQGMKKSIKIKHYDVLFSNYKRNLKKSWILLNEVINRNKTRDCSSKLLLNGECITDKLKIANGFNSYFVNVGPNLANNIPDTTISPLNNMNERNAFKFDMNPTTETEIISLIKLGKKMEVRVMIRSRRPQFRKQRLRLLHRLRIL